MILGPFDRASRTRPSRGCTAAASALLWGLVFLQAASCGLKADPVPRDSVVPVSVEDLIVRVEGGTVRLEFTLPKRSLDGSALKEIGGYRIVRRSPKGEESRREVRFSVSERRERVGRRILEVEPLPKEPGAYEYWVLPLDAYGSHPKRGRGAILEWGGLPVPLVPES